jgi:hypothetical protein
MSQRGKFEIPLGVPVLGDPIVIKPRTVSVCRQFAEAIGTKLYARRNNLSNPAKLVEDQVVGKVAEWAAYQHLEAAAGLRLSEPDMAIYGARQKSWACDLGVYGEPWGIHVKGQSLASGRLYGESWTFQASDRRALKEPHPLDLVAFVRVGSEGSDGIPCWVRAVWRVVDLHDRKLFKATKLYPESNKRAVYFDDLVVAP